MAESASLKIELVLIRETLYSIILLLYVKGKVIKPQLAGGGYQNKQNFIAGFCINPK